MCAQVKAQAAMPASPACWGAVPCASRASGRLRSTGDWGAGGSPQVQSLPLVPSRCYSPSDIRAGLHASGRLCHIRAQGENHGLPPNR